jgi:hypothetical protein
MMVVAAVSLEMDAKQQPPHMAVEVERVEDAEQPSPTVRVERMLHLPQPPHHTMEALH